MHTYVTFIQLENKSQLVHTRIGEQKRGTLDAWEFFKWNISWFFTKVMWDPGSHVTFGWPSASLTSRLIIAGVNLSSASALELITCTVSATFLSWVMWSLTPALLLSLMKSCVFSCWTPRRLEATWDQSSRLNLNPLSILISGPEQQNWGCRVALLFSELSVFVRCTSFSLHIHVKQSESFYNHQSWL